MLVEEGSLGLVLVVAVDTAMAVVVMVVVDMAMAVVVMVAVESFECKLSTVVVMVVVVVNFECKLSTFHQLTPGLWKQQLQGTNLVATVDWISKDASLLANWLRLGWLMVI